MSKLSINDALKHGVEAHRSGKVEEADRYYTAILQAQPNHPDANHNMGVLAVGLGKVEQALPFFTKALEANKSIEQFWLSYIDALIKLDRIDEAKAVGLRRAIKLPVSAPFHCGLMAPAAEVMRNALAANQINDAKMPVFCNVTAAA